MSRKISVGNDLMISEILKDGKTYNLYFDLIPEYKSILDFLFHHDTET